MARLVLIEEGREGALEEVDPAPSLSGSTGPESLAPGGALGLPDEVAWDLGGVRVRRKHGTVLRGITKRKQKLIAKGIAVADRKAGKLYNSRAIIDACRPFHWKDNFQKVNAPSPEARREAWDRWSHLRE